MTSIDLETATLSAPKSHIIRLTKQLRFIQDQHKSLRLKFKSHSLLLLDENDQNGENPIPVEIRNLLMDELKEDYTGILESDVLRLVQKCRIERNEYKHTIKQNQQTIEMLEDQCVNLQNDVFTKKRLIEQAKYENDRLNQDLQLTMYDLNNQMLHHSQLYDEYIREYRDDNITMSVENESIDTFAHTVATQTDSDMDSTIDMNSMNTDSISVQTDLSATSILTVEHFDSLMTQNQNDQYPLLISPPADTLDLELDLFKSEERMLNKDTKKKQSFSLFGKELFLRTRLRMEKRKRRYNEQKKEGMNTKNSERLQRLRMQNKKSNPFRCTKVVIKR